MAFKVMLSQAEIPAEDSESGQPEKYTAVFAELPNTMKDSVEIGMTVFLGCGVSRDGSDMKNMYLAAQRYGQEEHGYCMEVESLKRDATFSCIIHWYFNHFVVLDGFRGSKAVLNDPARDVVQVPMEQFDEAFTGLVLTFAPTEVFVPSGKRKSKLAFARKRLKGAGPAVAYIVLSCVISCLFGIINPVMSRIFYDRLLSGRAPDRLRPFIAVLAVVKAFEIIVQWAQTVYNFIVIAHRLSTTCNCDRIQVMDKGAIIDEGTCEALIEKDGYFAELAARQRLDVAG